MTSKTFLGAIIAIAFLAGTITTGTMASADPPADNPGRPFAAINALLEEIIMKIDDTSTAILAAISILSDDVEDIQSDIDGLETEISAIKNQLTDVEHNTDDILDDIGTLSGKFDNISEPLTQFRIVSFGVNEDETTTTTITSTGPMLADICNGLDSGVTLIQVIPPGQPAGPTVNEDSNCKTVGVNPDQTLELESNPAFNEDSTFVFVSIRTTPSATIEVQQSTASIPD